MADPLFDDLAALLCLARVVELRSFTQAARTLGVSKSLVSERLTALEARLGEQLLLRTTRQVTPTAAGLRVYEQARQIAEAGLAATRGASGAVGGVLRISAPVSLGQLHLAGPIAQFLRHQPHARVELLLDDRVVDLVEARIDLAVRVTKLDDSSLIARRLCLTSLHVCGAPAYFAKHGRPTQPEELSQHNCLRYSVLRPDHEWRLYRGRQRLTLTLGGNFEASNGLMLREAALAGIGLAMLPRFMVVDALARGQLVTVLDDFAPRPLGVYALRAGKRTPPRLVAALLKELEQAFRKVPWT
jgi:DNA-binding transcriptional LysR family regulator